MKNRVLRIIVIVVISGCVCYNIISSALTDLSAVETNADTDSVSIDIYEKAELKSVEKNINYLVRKKREEEEAKRKEEERLETYKNLEKQIADGKVTYRQLFADTYFLGDSLMHGLNSYRVLDSANMYTMVNASLYHLQSNIGRVVSNNPANVVLHYGINMLVNTESALNSYIDQYSSLIDSLKEKLPDSKIYISSIFNVSDKVSKRYSAIGKFNAALEEMCKQKGVIYIDNSVILPGDGSYYGADGIHLSKEFYSDVWLLHLYYAMNL